MVVLVTKEGQLVNRILHANYFLVNSLENHYKVWHLFFYDYYPYFSERLKKQKHIKFVFKKENILTRILAASIWAFTRLLIKLNIRKLPFLELIRFDSATYDVEPYNINNERFIAKAKSKIVLIAGWNFVDKGNLSKNLSLIRELWTPNIKYREMAEEMFRKMSRSADYTVGVHIRRKDYKVFNGGIWYYELAEYYNKMEEFTRLVMFRDKEIAFIICSDEKIDSVPEIGNTKIFYGDREFIIDLLLLSMCDYIIGPPSTFSMFASFQGRTPLLQLKSMEKPLVYSDFEVVTYD